MPQRSETKNSFDLKSFYQSLDNLRILEDKSWRDISRETGVTPSSFTRMKQGNSVEINTIAKLAKWGNLSLDAYVYSDIPDYKEIDSRRSFVIDELMRIFKSYKQGNLRT